eukprot:Platyproteum_vivax@DN6346_c0_g1_i1.p1
MADGDQLLDVVTDPNLLNPTAEESVTIINEYSAKHHSSTIKCSTTTDKGRVLIANRFFRKGERIFTEPPLHTVQEDKKHHIFKKIKGFCTKQNFDFAPLWYWAALNSLITEEELDKLRPEMRKKVDALQLMNISNDERLRLLLLFVPEVHTPSTDVEHILEGLGLTRYVDALLFEKLLQVWIHNCFEHTDEPLGYAVFFMNSFISHSCLPNAVWHYDQNDNFVLRARVDIQPNDELTISYLNEDCLFQSIEERRSQLQTTKGFICTCERCVQIVDRSRGFMCPNCQKGVMYVHMTNELVKDEMPKREKDEEGAPKSVMRCDGCKTIATPTQRAALLKIEKSMKKKVNLIESQLEKLKTTVTETLAQGTATKVPEPAEWKEVHQMRNSKLVHHWLSEKFDRLLQEYHAHQKLYNEALKRAESRLHFQESVYDAENASTGWCCDDLASLILKTYGQDEVPLSDDAPLNPAVADKLLATPALAAQVVNLYQRALHHLATVFGPKHEYCQQVQGSLECVTAALVHQPKST